MFRIGDFSRLSLVPVSALRYYDELNLLKPARVDPATGYRYYSASQLPRLNRLLAFKDMGLSLEQIANLLDKNLTSEQIRGMLKLKQTELKQQLVEGQARLYRLEAWLNQFEQEDKMSEHTVTIKQVEPCRVAAIRQIAPAIETMLQLLREVGQYVARQGVKPTGPDLFVFYHSGFRTENLDVEAMVPIEAELPESERVKVRTLPGVAQMASYVHRGSYETLRQAYANLGQWLETNAYTIEGPGREIYVHHDPHGSNHLTEIQFPVRKLF